MEKKTVATTQNITIKAKESTYNNKIKQQIKIACEWVLITILITKIRQYPTKNHKLHRLSVAILQVPNVKSIVKYNEQWILLCNYKIYLSLNSTFFIALDHLLNFYPNPSTSYLPIVTSWVRYALN